MSIFAPSDLLNMNEQGDRADGQEDDAERAMRLMADGVPLQLLVDIALPLTLVRELFTTTERTVSS